MVIATIILSGCSRREGTLPIPNNELVGKSYKAFFFKSPINGKNIHGIIEFKSNDDALMYTTENGEKDYSSENNVTYTFEFPVLTITNNQYKVNSNYSEIKQEFGYNLIYKRVN